MWDTGVVNCTTESESMLISYLNVVNVCCACVEKNSMQFQTKALELQFHQSRDS